jgi:hypothetical protein
LGIASPRRWAADEPRQRGLFDQEGRSPVLHLYHKRPFVGAASGAARAVADNSDLEAVAVALVGQLICRDGCRQSGIQDDACRVLPAASVPRGPCAGIITAPAPAPNVPARPGDGNWNQSLSSTSYAHNVVAFTSRYRCRAAGVKYRSVLLQFVERHRVPIRTRFCGDRDLIARSGRRKREWPFWLQSVWLIWAASCEHTSAALKPVNVADEEPSELDTVIGPWTPARRLIGISFP